MAGQGDVKVEGVAPGLRRAGGFGGGVDAQGTEGAGVLRGSGGVR